MGVSPRQERGARMKTTQTPYLLEAPRSQLITGVVTLGRGDTDQWITNYTVSTSVTGSEWSPVDGGRVFPGNTDRHTPVTARFRSPIPARLVKIFPLGWHNHLSMRVELLGCANEESRCGALVPAEQCASVATSAGGTYYYAAGYATDDPLAKVPTARGGKALDYPDNSATFGQRGAPPSTGGAEVYIGRGVNLDQCAIACDSDAACTAFTLLEEDVIGECWLHNGLDGKTLDWKSFGVLWTTYRKATDTMTNRVVPPQTPSAVVL